jgi:hypothetical protein
MHSINFIECVDSAILVLGMFILFFVRLINCHATFLNQKCHTPAVTASKTFGETQLSWSSMFCFSLEGCFEFERRVALSV